MPISGYDAGGDTVVKIAHILPYGAKFPLTKHNGRYEWVLRLARLQVAAGNEVIIFSGTEAWVEEPEITWRTCTKEATKLSTNKSLFREALADQSFDIFHSHFDSLHSLMGHLTQKPIVCTQHWFPTEKIAQDATRDTPRNVIYVPVTHFMQQADLRLGIPCSEVIYHGIDLALFHPQNTVSDRFIFVGRISPGKGAKEAVEIAVKAGISLDIYGKINEAEQSYFNSFAHLIDGDTVTYHGAKPLDEIAEAMARAKALLFPCNATEAFGQVTVEAQACGTPVIISNVGASQELVLDGKTGFVIDEFNDYIRAINNIDSIDRTLCRRHAETYDLRVMVSRYDQLYKSLRK